MSIPNHVAPKLSELDLEVISHIPPGGNWKDVPESVPSKRLEQIRASFRAGKGSRSTYYGRLLGDDPSYTISTYFTRPGNGTNIHYAQDRTLSFREAARLQSFPDHFEFIGSKTAIANQIGNAVPPLLSYQIARSMSLASGGFVDLFSGAGGLALGFYWAGWTPVVSNDNAEYALRTHERNLPGETIMGDIGNVDIEMAIVSRALEYRKQNPSRPLLVLGGPPCQGFSTANGGRSSTDQRNWLFRRYVEILKKIQPDGFIFENVPGILNLEKGAFFEMIQEDFKTVVDSIKVEKVNAANFGVPQRRNRVILVGGGKDFVEGMQLKTCSIAPRVVSRELRGIDHALPNMITAITAHEALGDLPELKQNEDGSASEYPMEPFTRYQELMRGDISAEEFVARIR